MQQQKQEELFEEVEVVDDPEERGRPQETSQVIGDTEGTPKVKKTLVKKISQSILSLLKKVFQNLRTV